MAKQAKKEDSYAMDALKDIIGGTFGGIAQTIAGHPLDTVKVRLQTQVTVPGQPPQFAGMVDCFRKTIKGEGFFGLYKGAASPMAGAMAMNAALFFSYGQSKHIVTHFAGKPKDSELTLSELFVAGGLAGFFTSLVETPFDLVKIKLQGQVGKGGAYTGVFDAAGKIWKQFGVRGLYQGLQSNIWRDVPAFAGYFWSYEWARRAMTKPGEVPSYLTCFIAGGVGGFGFWGVVYPLEMIKTRMQSDSLVHAERRYKSYVDCWKKTYAEEGFKGMWKGYVPSILRAVPVNACVFLTVTAIKRNLGGAS